jgi:hypothetical protein
MFPNITELTIDWEVMDGRTYQMEPNRSGNHLQHLKRLNIILNEGLNSAAFEPLQADVARSVLKHLPAMPSLQSVAIEFGCSVEGRNYDHDLGEIRDALCEIGSPELQHVTVRSILPIWATPFPNAWVSNQFGSMAPLLRYTFAM